MERRKMMLMVEMKRMMKMRDYYVFVAFFPNRLFVTVFAVQVIPTLNSFS